MISKIKNNISVFSRILKIRNKRNYWTYHQEGIRKAKKKGWDKYLDCFDFERNYHLIKILSYTLNNTLENTK